MCPMNACRPPFNWLIRVPDRGDRDARPESQLVCVLIGGPLVRALTMTPDDDMARCDLMTCSRPCLTQRVAR